MRTEDGDRRLGLNGSSHRLLALNISNRPAIVIEIYGMWETQSL
ncbi:hypothetical protein [Phormidium pseudopriestleyi]|nr:hypothetical protein [Phormidium pseudopriestleyi]